jgi:uncharacterized membrane-anchored protein
MRSPTVTRKLWILLAAFIGFATPIWAQSESTIADLPWQQGPTTGELGTIARIEVPQGFMFLPEALMPRFDEVTENLPDPSECGVVLYVTESDMWFAIFSFDEIGHVNDDEGRSLDADKLMASIRESAVKANQERTRRHWATMQVNGWTTRPYYNPDGHHLEWGLSYTATTPEDSSSQVVNHHIKLLGRDGVMTCQIVGSPEVIPAAVQEMRKLLLGYSFVEGRKFEEFRNGDKVAAVGLTGLILGGAAVAATKSGFFAKLLKPLIVGIGAVLLGLVRRIGSLFKGRSDDDPSSKA